MPVLPVSATSRIGGDRLSLVHGVVCNMQLPRMAREDGLLAGNFLPLVSPETGLLRFAPAVQALS
jgi:hypothetical protein